MMVTCSDCGLTEEMEVVPCRHHGEPAHRCELLCPECVNVLLAQASTQGLSNADIRWVRKELGL